MIHISPLIAALACTVAPLAFAVEISDATSVVRDYVAAGDINRRDELINAGIYEKTGQGTTLVSDAFWNMESGSFTVHEGTFAFDSIAPWSFWSNSGTLNVAGGQVRIVGNPHYDVWVTNAGGTINIQAGSMSLEWTGIGTGGSVWNISPGAELSFETTWGDAIWLLPMVMTFHDTVINNEGTLRFSGPFTEVYFTESATLTGSGRILVEDGARVIYAAVPEPGSVILTMLGIAFFAAFRRRAVHISRCSPALSPPRIT